MRHALDKTHKPVWRRNFSLPGSESDFIG